MLSAAGFHLAEWSMYRRNRLLSAKAAALVPGEGAVVAPYGAAVEVFRAAEKSGAMRVLDYPVAHHRYRRRLLREEAQHRPEFAATLTFDRWPPDVVQRLDEECALADCILVGSTFAKESFVAEGIPPQKVTVIPYGVDVSTFYPSSTGAHDAFRVLFVGQIGQRKGISYLLEAYRRFRRPGSELVLIGNVVGDPCILAPYRELLRHVTHVPHSDIPRLFRSASVLVLPSLVEGMSLVVLEAMASGLPVVVSTNTGAADVVRDGVDGFLIPVRNPDAIVEKLELLHRDPERRRWMGQNARARAEEFTWDCYTRRVVDALSKCSTARTAYFSPASLLESTT
jgi:glycosyltransferase involved in cell wall biosynthesis